MLIKGSGARPYAPSVAEPTNLLRQNDCMQNHFFVGEALLQP